MIVPTNSPAVYAQQVGRARRFPFNADATILTQGFIPPAEPILVGWNECAEIPADVWERLGKERQRDAK